MSKQGDQALKEALANARRNAGQVEQGQLAVLCAILDVLLRIEDKLDRVTVGGNALMTVQS